MEKYFGKYRGKVLNNIDPMMLGRVQVEVPSVLGDGQLAWAMPCAPYAGNGVGFFFIPPPDANVWVEFEGGSIDAPIYSGGFWGPGEAPATPAVAQMKVLKMETITLTFSEIPGLGGVTLEVEPPTVAVSLRMVFDSTGITINAGPMGEIKLTPASVSINSGALEVM